MRTLPLVMALLALAGPASAADHTVRMSGMSFAPADLVVKRGDSITFVNDDTDRHQVYSATEGFMVNMGAQKPGETKTLTVGKKGRFSATCVFHPHMTMTVTVKE